MIPDTNRTLRDDERMFLMRCCELKTRVLVLHNDSKKVIEGKFDTLTRLHLQLNLDCSLERLPRSAYTVSFGIEDVAGVFISYEQVPPPGYIVAEDLFLDVPSQLSLAWRSAFRIVPSNLDVSMRVGARIFKPNVKNISLTGVQLVFKTGEQPPITVGSEQVLFLEHKGLILQIKSSARWVVQNEDEVSVGFIFHNRLNGYKKEPDPYLVQLVTAQERKWARSRRVSTLVQR